MIYFFRISGHSMEPYLREGNIALCVKYFFGSPKTGHVVFFRYKDKLVVKRVRRIYEKKVVVAGDNEADSKNFVIEKKAIIGRVIFKF